MQLHFWRCVCGDVKPLIRYHYTCLSPWKKVEGVAPPPFFNFPPLFSWAILSKSVLQLKHEDFLQQPLARDAYLNSEDKRTI
jgi:hypothetical protein